MGDYDARETYDALELGADPDEIIDDLLRETERLRAERDAARAAAAAWKEKAKWWRWATNVYNYRYRANEVYRMAREPSDD